MEAFEKDDSGAWIPLRLRAWKLASVQACVSFLGKTASNNLVPLLEYGELGQASRE